MKSLSIVRQSAFTFIELMVVVAVLAILAALAGPSMSNFLGNANMRAAASDLVIDVALMRSEAARRGTPVVMCPTSDSCSSTSAPTCTGATDWNLNRLVFVDVGGVTGEYNSASGDVLVRCEKKPPKVTVSLNVSESSLRASPSGWLNRDGVFSVCLKEMTQRNVVFKRTGRGLVDVTGTACP